MKQLASILTIVFLYVLAFEVIGFSSTVQAQTSTQTHESGTASGSYLKDVWERDKLTGDWGGLRSDLSKHGIDFIIKGSMFNQKVTTGGMETSSWQTGYKGDIWASIDMKKLFGTWDGLSLSVHIESRTGEDISGEAGSLVFPSAALLYPLPDDFCGTRITGITVNQTLFGGKAAVLAGKLHAFDLLNGFFPNIIDSGLGGFMNANSFLSITSWGRWLTLSQYGAAAWTIEPTFGAQTGILFTGGANTTDEWSLDDSWDGGTGILGFHRFILSIDDKPGYLFIGVGGSTQDYPRLDESDFAVYPGEGVESTNDGKPWEVALYLYQIIWQDDGNKNRFIQTFMGGSFGDDNVSFSDYDIFASIQSFGLFCSRPDDRIGLAASYYHLSNGFTRLVNDVSPDGLRNSYWTLETFYNFQVTPWLHLSPNIQYTKAPNKGTHNAFIVGSRLVIDF
jgi:porin